MISYKVKHFTEKFSELKTKRQGKNDDTSSRKI